MGYIVSDPKESGGISSTFFLRLMTNYVLQSVGGRHYAVYANPFAFSFLAKSKIREIILQFTLNAEFS